MIRKNILMAAVLLMAASAAGFAFNALRSDPLPLVQDWKKTLAGRQSAQMAGAIDILDLEAMEKVYRDPGVLVLDARPEDFFLMEHIPGAKSFPLERADELLKKYLDKIPEDYKIITYCDGASCPAARELAEKLTAAGWKNVTVFLDGIEVWTARNLPVEQGEAN